MNIEEYLIADSKAHIAALKRAQDGKARDLICAAMKRNAQFKIRAEDRHGKKSS